MVPEFAPPPLPRSWPPVSIAIAAVSFAIFLARLCARKRLDPRETVLVCLAVAHIVLVAVLWLTYDRYLLVLLPLGIALLLRSTPETRATAPALLLIPFAVASLIGLHDHLSYNRAIWHGVEVLRRAGARDSEIDGGYVVNGWLQYAHPENAPRDERGNLFVPHLTNEVDLRYRISGQRLPGWRVLETVPVRRWLGAREEFYALEDSRLRQ
jgi:hypothetical protein